ncbi:MAG: glycoprotease [Ruthenibacterium sp.]
MLTLGIDTSNYATSLAVFCTDTKEVVCATKRFLPVKQGELGLRQSDAVFHHTQALPELLREMSTQSDFLQIGAVGVSARPRPVEGSYMPCFLTGVAAATAFAFGRGVPLCETTHQQGHIAAALYATGDETLFHKETLVFHISGGTTELLLCKDNQVLCKVGGSTDLYAGQAVDRIGVKLGFAFPAGAEVSALAETCAEAMHPKVSVNGTNCSLSGLENQCNHLLSQGAAPAYAAKYCLCAVGETILRMVKAARQQYPAAAVVCAGGVMSSSIVRSYVQSVMPEVHFVPAQYAGDNAIGVAVLTAGEGLAWRTQSV